MKTLILVLIICSFIQSTILPVDLVLIILICRSYLRADKANLWLAFSFGLLNAHLNLTTLGFHSLIYLNIVAVTESLSKSRLAGNLFLIIPLSLILLSINQFISSVIFHEVLLSLPKLVTEALLSLPILYLVKIWEERFIVQKEIKLKI